MKDFLLFIYFAAALLWSDPGPGATYEVGLATSKDVAAHAYHGILWSREDASGAYFYRNNERCSLYSKAFLRMWEGS